MEALVTFSYLSNRSYQFVLHFKFAKIIFIGTVCNSWWPLERLMFCVCFEVIVRLFSQVVRLFCVGREIGLYWCTQSSSICYVIVAQEKQNISVELEKNIKCCMRSCCEISHFLAGYWQKSVYSTVFLVLKRSLSSWAGCLDVGIIATMVFFYSRYCSMF